MHENRSFLLGSPMERKDDHLQKRNFRNTSGVLNLLHRHEERLMIVVMRDPDISLEQAMDEAEFDRFAEEYRAIHAKNIRMSGESPEYFAEYKIKAVAASLMDTSLPIRILDFGAGIGNSVPYFLKHLPKAEVTCLDVSSKSLEIGQKRFGEKARFVKFDGRTITLPAQSFDIAFAACVFHHIEEREHVLLLRQIRNVLSPSGRLWLFEHNPLNPLTVKVVRDCPFDENAQLIDAATMRRRIQEAGFGQAVTHYRVFFPRALSALRWTESALRWVPIGAQYSVEAFR
jgi:ubiquinone/menaquinone biosynthesis C-methylase UbiE